MPDPSGFGWLDHRHGRSAHCRYSMTARKEPRLMVAPKRVARFQAKLKMALRRARGGSIARPAR